MTARDAGTNIKNRLRKKQRLTQTSGRSNPKFFDSLIKRAIAVVIFLYRILRHSAIGSPDILQKILRI